MKHRFPLNAIVPRVLFAAALILQSVVAVLLTPECAPAVGGKTSPEAIVKTVAAASQPGRPDSGNPVTPDAPHIDISLTFPDSLLAGGDSIFAREIHVESGGIQITDRDGRTFYITNVEISPIPEPRPRSLHRRNQADRSDRVYILTEMVTIEADEVVNGDVVCLLGGNIDVLGRVEGTVFSMFGTINVEGTVEDAAVAPFGVILVGPNGEVNGDVIASEIDKEPGGRIGGIRNELFLKVFGDQLPIHGGQWAQTTLGALTIIKVLFLFFLVLLAHALAAHNVAKVKGKIVQSPWKAFFMGLFAQILLLPVVVILTVTVVGIPVVIFLVPLMIVGAVILGQAAFGLFVGEKIHENTPMPLHSPLARTLVGLLAIQSVSLIAVAVTWMTSIPGWGPPLKPVAVFLFGFAILIGYVLFTAGTGAVVLTRFGTRPKEDSTKPENPVSDKTSPGATADTPTPLPQRTETDPPGTPPSVS